MAWGGYHGYQASLPGRSQPLLSSSAVRLPLRMCAPYSRTATRQLLHFPQRFGGQPIQQLLYLRHKELLCNGRARRPSAAQDRSIGLQARSGPGCFVASSCAGARACHGPVVVDPAAHALLQLNLRCNLVVCTLVCTPQSMLQQPHTQAAVTDGVSSAAGGAGRRRGRAPVRTCAPAP